MNGSLFVRNLSKFKTVANLDVLDDETTKMVRMLVILRLNKTPQSLDPPAGNEEKEKCALAGLMKFESVMKEY